jgi:hypothetical protein
MARTHVDHTRDLQDFVIHPHEVEAHSYVAIADGHKIQHGQGLRWILQLRQQALESMFGGVIGLPACIVSHQSARGRKRLWVLILANSDPEYALYYKTEVAAILIHEFQIWT